MPAKPLLLLLLTVMMGCTAFGPDGTVPMAIHKDMVNRHPQCNMSDEEWMEKCGRDFSLRTRAQQELCPIECQPEE
jgi:hypothetical protein